MADSLQELNARALAGELRAAVELASRSTAETLTDFLMEQVPPDEVAAVFDVMADAWWIVKEGQPLPDAPPELSNLNGGWK